MRSISKFGLSIQWKLVLISLVFAVSISAVITGRSLTGNPWSPYFIFGCILGFATIIYLIVLGTTITGNIRKINNALSNIARPDLNQEIKIGSGDEIKDTDDST